MKNFPRISVYAATTLLALGAVCFQQWSPAFAVKHAPAVIVQTRGRSLAKIAKNKLHTSAPMAPAPLDHPSEQELLSYPGATVVEAEEIEDPTSLGQKIRMRILKTHFKSPYVRTEEVIDTDSGNLLGRVEMAADHFLVNVPEGSTPQEIFNQFGPEVVSMEPVVADASLWRVNLANHSLATLADVLWFQAAATGEPDRIYGLHDFLIEQATKNQWALPRINAPAAWNIPSSHAKPTIVAIIDTGVRYTHQDLAGNMWVNPDPAAPDHYGTNAVAQLEQGENPNDPMDDCGHGTHCAGIIGGIGIGIQGVAPQVQIMACKYMDKNGVGMLSDEVTCLHYAVEHGATVLNCSYGVSDEYSIDGFSFKSPYALFSRSEYNAMKYARDKGVMVAVAAGNDANNNDVHPSYPASYSMETKYPTINKEWRPVLESASALDNIVSVAATDETDQICSFSNYGVQSVSIGAPGKNILSTWSYSDTAYTFLSGTSMAAPHVAGALALMRAKFPNASYQSLMAHLLETADPIPSLEGKTKAGRLNLLKALTWD